MFGESITIQVMALPPQVVLGLVIVKDVGKLKKTITMELDSIILDKLVEKS
jgi:hypothetical protein